MDKRTRWEINREIAGMETRLLMREEEPLLAAERSGELDELGAHRLKLIRYELMGREAGEGQHFYPDFDTMIARTAAGLSP